MPSTPSSLVKLAARLASVSTGASSSSPARDHVPVAMYAKSGVVAGTPTTADAVSCEPTAVTGTGVARPVSARTSGRRVPAGSPGWRRGGKSVRSMPRACATGVAQSRVRGSMSWVVEAFVSSVPGSPVSQYEMRSGMRRRRWAAVRAGVPRAEMSW
ncbi:hypothetical protein SANTM175S_10631 [Streptomyces antimycoticus]